MKLNDIVKEWKRFGGVKTFQDLGLRALNRAIGARILKGVTIDTVDPGFLKCQEPFHGGFLNETVLGGMTRNHPEYEISERFLREAFSRGDECYGIRNGSELAAYGWYSNRPTAIDAPGVMLHFDPRYIYMYKGFTHEKYRGQRLHSVAVTQALDAYLARGYKGFVSYVEWNNFGSLKSCYRMGYSDFGNIYLVRLFGKYLTFAGRGCASYGFRLEQDRGISAGRDGQTARLSVDQTR
jgi:hypothetical protein